MAAKCRRFSDWVPLKPSAGVAQRPIFALRPLQFFGKR